MTPIIAKGGGRTFVPAPAGTFRAVCVDVVDLGEMEQVWNGKPRKSHKIRIAWQIDQPMEDGKLFVVSQMFTLSFHQKSGLRQMVESWFAREFSLEDETNGFDVESLLGQSCIVTVQQVKREKGVFANVVAVSPLMNGMPQMLPRDYTRVSDRDITAQSEHADEQDPDNVPF